MTVSGHIQIDSRRELERPETWLTLPISRLLDLAKLALYDDNEQVFENLRMVLTQREAEMVGATELRRDWNTIARLAAFENHDLPARNIHAKDWPYLSMVVSHVTEWATKVRPEAKQRGEPAGNVYAVLLYNVAGNKEFSVYVGSTSETVDQRVAKHLGRYKAGRGLVYWYGIRGGRADDYAGEMVLWGICQHFRDIPKSQLLRFEKFLADTIRAVGVTVYGGAQEFVADRVRVIRDPYLLHGIIMGADTSWRHERVPLPDGGLRDDAFASPLYEHQDAALRAIARSQDNGIICLPTGAGKTRIAVEYMASLLQRDRDRHRFLWVSYPTVVLKQGMAALLDWRDRLPNDLYFRWASEGQAGDSSLLDDVHVTFLLRGSLAQLLQPGTRSPLLSWLAGDRARRVTIILDEVHTLLTPEVVSGLDRALGSARGLSMRDRVRLIGFSATPIPTSSAAIAAMQRYFPVAAGGCRPKWGVHVLEFRDAPAMVADKVTCPPNLYIDRMKVLRVPEAVLRRATMQRREGEALDDIEANTGSAHLSNSGNMPPQFENHARRVLEHPEVCTWLARRLVDLQGVLGKTIVFAASIDAANVLYRRLRELGANAFVVHSMLDQMTPHQGTDSRMNVAAQVAGFKATGSPSFMVNVGILTTGFDDPAIQTVVLARPARSLNLFWQMVGRGLRGPRAKGTECCNVIDIVDLQQLFSLDDGYRPESHQLLRFGAEGWFGLAGQGPADATAQPRAVLRAPSKLASLLLDRDGWPDFIRLRSLLLSLEMESLPNKRAALLALERVGIPPTPAVGHAPESGNQATFWTVHLVRLFEERRDIRFVELAVRQAGASTVEEQYDLYLKVEQLLSEPVDVNATVLGLSSPAAKAEVGGTDSETPLQHDGTNDTNGLSSSHTLLAPPWLTDWERNDLFHRSAAFREGLRQLVEQGVVVEPSWVGTREIHIRLPGGDVRRLVYLYGSGPWVDLQGPVPVGAIEAHGGEVRHDRNEVRFTWEQSIAAIDLIRLMLTTNSAA